MLMDKPLSEHELIQRIQGIAEKNKIWRSFIGMGYYNTCIPHTILRNMFENPGWTTQYTPYQPEIAQVEIFTFLIYNTKNCLRVVLSPLSTTKPWCLS